MLGQLVIERRHEFFVPNTQEPGLYKKYIALGSYHNKVLHLFAQEALWACALYALDRNAEKNRNLKKGETRKAKTGFILFLPC